ncbi:S9 family peptidase [Acidicapsa acidisoli]|uniref:S9 family peptidase n=1 Tax=Acidicapsa acidisoli TaxID=1615681 RepID=UPI0021DF673A|nr:S9 family peptidase [Acidicapsa acidisoli]
MRNRLRWFAASVFFPVLLFSICPPKELPAQAPAKRPMTFADMMQMRRLGDTDVSPDGKWLLYSVTDVDLAQNTRTPKLWIQPVTGGEPKQVEGTQPADGGARFSHDGKQLLFLSSRSGSQQIWLADFDLATGTTTNIRNATKNVRNPATNVGSPTSNAENPAINIPEADNALWSPDGKSIVFTASVYPDCRAITPENPDGAKCTIDRDAAQAASKVKARIFDHLLYKHWNAFTGDKRSHLFLLTVETGAIRDLTPNDPRDVPPFSLEGGCGCAFSPDSKELAFTENLDEEPAISTNADIFTLNLTNSTAKPVKISTSPGGDFNPAYSPDGKYLAWRSQARPGYESDKFRLVIYDRTTKQIKDSLPNFDRWVDEFVWSPDSNKIYFVAGNDGMAQIFDASRNGIDKTGTGLNRFVGADSNEGEFNDLHIAGDGKTLLATRMKVGQPGEVVQIRQFVEPQREKGDVVIGTDFVGSKQELEKLVALGDPEKKEITKITHLNDDLLAKLDLSQLESFWFKAADKTEVEGFLIKPPAFDPAKKYPVKFLIHGGPQGAWGDSWSYRWNAELLAANGYVVVMINPRGSTGYGQTFVDGVNGDWGGKPFTDLMLGLDYAEKTYPFIDKNRECALGASYGGYMANWILGHTNRFKCIVTHDGMFDPESAYGSTEELWFNEWEFKGKPWDYYGHPDSENPFRRWSPALSAKNFKTPTLVIHSQLDYRLDVSEGYQLFTTLQRLKVPSKMLYFPDEGHWVQKPQNSELWYKTVNAWVDQWIGSAGIGSAGSREQGTGNRE